LLSLFLGFYIFFSLLPSETSSDSLLVMLQNLKQND